MLARLIDGSALNPILVILLVLLSAGWGLWAGFQVPLDAVLDLSGVQVTIYAEWAILETGLRQLVFMDRGQGRYEWAS